MQYSIQFGKCTFIPTEYDITGCKGPADMSIVKREQYNQLQYPCPINQYSCQQDDGTYTCEQCCMDYNTIGQGNPNCEISQFCSEDNTCKNIIESDMDCQQLTCIDGYCQACHHQQLYQNQYTCIEGQIYTSSVSTTLLVNWTSSIMFACIVVSSFIVAVSL